MPADCVQVLSLRLGSDDVEFVDDATWNAYSDATGYTSHTLGRVFGSTIELYPTPSAGTSYAIRYAYVPLALAQPEDEPEIAANLQPRLVQYTLAMCKYKEGEPGEGDRYLSLYEAGLPAPPLGSLTQRPGPLSIGFAEGPFDIDPDAIHR